MEMFLSTIIVFDKDSSRLLLRTYPKIIDYELRLAKSQNSLAANERISREDFRNEYKS